MAPRVLRLSVSPADPPRLSFKRARAWPARGKAAPMKMQGSSITANASSSAVTGRTRRTSP